MTQIFTTDFDDKLIEINIYKKHSQLLPLIGNNYLNQKKKVIFIGESHYLPHASQIHENSETWYNSNVSQLNLCEKEWTNTRHNAGSGVNQKYQSKAFRIYQNIEKSIINIGFTPQLMDNMFRYCCFYNYFQRPAKTGMSLNNDMNDDEVAINTFNSLVEILKFDFAFFVSRKAYHSFRANEKCGLYFNLHNTFSLPHPGSIWWNRKSRRYLNQNYEPMTGKENFQMLLRENGIFI